MTIRSLPTLVVVSAAAVFAVAPRAARAEIAGFTIENVTPSSLEDVEQSDGGYKIGLSLCRELLEQEASLVCDGSGSTDADATSGDTRVTDTSSVADTASTDDAGAVDGTDSAADTGTAAADATDATDGTDTTDAADAGGGTDATDATDGTGGATKPGAISSALNTSAVITFTVRMNSTSSNGVELTQYAYAIGTSCSTSAEPEDNETSCKVLLQFDDNTAWSGLDLTFTTGQLLGDSCDTAATKYLYVYVKDSAGTITNEKIELALDRTAPSAPTVTGAAAGETNVTVSWDDTSTDDDLEHVVYYSEREFTYDEIGDSDVRSTGRLTTTSGKHQVTGLTNGTTYYFAVTAVDEGGNESTFCDTSDLVSGAPKALDDFYEHYRSQPGANEKGGFSFCFVATAAWGSPVAPTVDVLRQFRDQRMMSGTGGQALVNLYGQVGPKAASVISESEWLRSISRVLLWPLVILTLLVMAAPAWGPAAVVGAAFTAWRLRRHRRRAGDTNAGEGTAR